MGRGFGLGSFILGGLIGAGIALLYAPRPGEETRAIVADKVDELWGEGQAFYTQGRTYVTETVHNVREGGLHKDELREKIESARTVIADQVAKNAAAARDAINDKVPVAAEKINQMADVVKGQIDAAAGKLKTAAATEAEADAQAIADAATADATPDAASAEQAPAAPGTAATEAASGASA